MLDFEFHSQLNSVNLFFSVASTVDECANVTGCFDFAGHIIVKCERTLLK